MQNEFLFVYAWVIFIGCVLYPPLADGDARASLTLINKEWKKKLWLFFWICFSLHRLQWKETKLYSYCQFWRIAKRTLMLYMRSNSYFFKIGLTIKSVELIKIALNFKGNLCACMYSLGQKTSNLWYSRIKIESEIFINGKRIHKSRSCIAAWMPFLIQYVSFFSFSSSSSSSTYSFLQAAFLTCFSSWNRWWKSNMAIEYFKRSTQANSIFLSFFKSNQNRITLKMTTKWNEEGKKQPSPFMCGYFALRWKFVK